jgi:D-alanine-D-alanine ligase
MCAQRLSIGLLFGGESPEHEVSIVSAKSIAQNIDAARFELRPMGIAKNGVWVVKGDPFARLSANELPERGSNPFLPLEKGAEETPLPDVFFNAIHGAFGEDGRLQGYLDMLKRPYTGAGLLGMAAGMDKWVAKLIWTSVGIPQVPYVGLTEEAWQRDPGPIQDQILALGLPVFVKPANAGSSIGIRKVKVEAELADAVAFALSYDRRVVVEKGVDAREIELAVLGGDDPVVSLPGEVHVAGEFYDFNDKYIDGKSWTETNAQLPEGITERLQAYAKEAFRSLDASGMARVDFFLERGTDAVYLNEINLIPGFTSISMYPKLMESIGVGYAELITRLIELALERSLRLQGKQKGFESGSNWYA